MHRKVLHTAHPCNFRNNVQEKMSEELSDCQQQLQIEREEKAKAIAQVESLCAQAGKLGAELQAVKAAGVDATGDISFKVALEAKQTELNKLISRIEELEAMVARLSKERDLINKKMDRVQEQKDAETSSLKQQLEKHSSEVQMQVNERDRRINELMEELGNREVRFSPYGTSCTRTTAAILWCSQV